MSALAVQITQVSSSWLAAEERWEVLLELRFTNSGPAVFELDKATACAGGRLENSVLQVMGPEGEVSYRGMMKKRAHPGPEGFHRVAPGASVEVCLDVGQGYSFPAGGGVFTLRFDHFNHFSKDAQQLVSEPLTLNLTR